MDEVLTQKKEEEEEKRRKEEEYKRTEGEHDKRKEAEDEAKNEEIVPPDGGIWVNINSIKHKIKMQKCFLPFP